MFAPFAMSPYAADVYPIKPIRLLVGFTPGGAADFSARVTSRKMSESLGTNIVVENRPGAGGNISAQIVATAAADGYTLYWGSVGPLTVSPALGVKLGYDPLTDFAPIGLAVRACNVLAARPAFAGNTVADVIALAKSKPGQLNYATQGLGSTGHLAGELLRSMTGIELVPVAYKGGSEGITALLAGEIDLAFVSVTGVRAIGPGRLKPLGVTCARRDPGLSAVPTFAESGVKDYDATFWYGLLAPGGTRAVIIDKLNGAMVAALADPAIAQQLEVQGLLSSATTPAQFRDTIRDDYAKWKKVLARR